MYVLYINGENPLIKKYFEVILFLITDRLSKRLRFTDIGEHETIKYTDIPFIILSKYERHCLFGKDKNRKKRETSELKKSGIIGKN